MKIPETANVFLCLRQLFRWNFSSETEDKLIVLDRHIYKKIVLLFLMAALQIPDVKAQSASKRNPDDEYERIVTEEDFVKRIVGKNLTYESGAVIVFLEDRSFGGGFSGSRVWGEWDWRDDKICHQMNIGEKRYKVACKIPQIMKKRLRFIREDGSSYGVAKIK